MMIDVLTAMTIVASVLFSLLFYQMDHLKAVHAAFYRVIAINQLDNFVSLLNSHHASYARDKLFQLWNEENKQLLPNGAGQWFESSSHECHVSVRWIYQRKQSETITVMC